MSERTYENTEQGKQINLQILKMLQALCVHYRHRSPREFITGIVIGKEEYEKLVGFLLTDETQPRYRWQGQLPTEFQDIPLVVIQEPGIHFGIDPRLISIHSMPTL